MPLKKSDIMDAYTVNDSKVKPKWFYADIVSPKNQVNIAENPIAVMGL